MKLTRKTSVTMTIIRMALVLVVFLLFIPLEPMSRVSVLYYRSLTSIKMMRKGKMNPITSEK
uniref:Uncharacterized protein n=1 Tax=Anguilla anguilla TaxID=7936 RepID=A0A0E9SHQ3_ANGAN